MQEYPASPNINEARYYVAESYRLTNEPENALRYYNLVIADNKSDYLIRSATRAADLEAKQRNFPRAIRNYQIILGKASSKVDQVSAQLGLMDTYFVYPKLDSAAILARDIVAGGSVVAGAQNRAQLMLGKIAYAKNDFKTAQAEFEKTIALAKDANGAEALYNLGEILYKQKKYKESIATLLKFNEQFSDFEYWKGKAFIMVADNNVALDETTQAKAVLNSIIENSSDETVKAEAKQKLATLEAKN